LSNAPAERQIDRPLGLPGSRPSARGRFRRGDVVTLLVGAIVLASSTAVALRDSPFRTPAPVVVATPEAGTAPEASAPVADAQPRDGPSIIRVEEQQTGGGSVVVRDPLSMRQDERTAHMPDRALIEDSEHGPLPIRAADGRRPFDVYQRGWSGARGARVAIVIGGLGVSQTGTQNAISRLPPEITLAFASGGNSLDRWMQTARREGHEIVMQVPLEPFDYPSVDPGRNTLTVDAGEAENRSRLHWTLSRITNYTGVMNYMGARFVTDEAAMRTLFAELAARGIAYYDDGSSARSLAEGMAEANRVPYAAADIAIDAVRERPEVMKKLDELERTARARGFAVATGSAFDVTVEAVAAWAAEASLRGIEIVPISAVADDPERR
jgi:polysaccharide deacetylase 2 family uncharacterized protein YibQ